RLMGGHVIVTARASNFPESLPTLELDVLDEAPATQFLLERTRGKRVAAADDETLARELARELGGLALGLEQAGAYIAKQRIPFARYLKIWTENREKALAWSDATLTGSERLSLRPGSRRSSCFRPKAAACSTGSRCSRLTRSPIRCSTFRFPAKRPDLTPMRRAPASPA